MSKAKIIKGLLSLFQKKANPTAAKFKKLPETLEAEAEGRKALLELKQLGFMDETGGITEKALNPRGKAINKLDDILESNRNPLQEEMDRMLALEKSNLDKLKIQSAEMEEMTKVLDEFLIYLD